MAVNMKYEPCSPYYHDAWSEERTRRFMEQQYMEMKCMEEQRKAVEAQRGFLQGNPFGQMSPMDAQRAGAVVGAAPVMLPKRKVLLLC